MNKNRSVGKLRYKLLAILVIAVGGLLLFGLFHPPASHAATGINQQLNFQGRLLDNTGAVVPDGSYNMEFKIYQDGNGCVGGGTSPCSGTLKWTEDWIQTNRVTVKNGYFSVNLGSLTAFAANINWNSDTLWLSTNIGGTTNTPTPTYDGEMTPFKRLAASPYSLNSNALGGLTATNFVQLAQGVQADTSTVNPSIFINKNNATGTPNILELQKSGVDVFNIDNTGNITATGKYNTDTISSSAITFGGTSTANIDAASGQTLQLGASSGGITLAANTTITGSVGLSSLTNCTSLATDGTGSLGCGSAGPAVTASFVDTTPAAYAANTTTELFNDATKPSIVPPGSGSTILVSVDSRATGNSNTDSSATIRIVRNIGSAASCTSSTQIGDLINVSFTTNTGGTDKAEGTGVFLDSPATGSRVFYTVCSSALAGGQTHVALTVNLVALGGTASMTTLQSAYDAGNTVTAADGTDLLFNLADTTTDPNFLVNLECATTCGGNGRFAIQNAGTDVFSVSPNSGNIALAPAGTGDVMVTGDNDSNLQVNSTFTGTGPSQTAFAINLTDNATAAGTSYGLSVTNADNTTNAGVPSALAYLNNANAGDTVPDGMLVEQTGAGTLTNGIEVKQTAGAITNGLTFTGTFTSVLKVGSTTVLNGSGVVQSASISGTYSNALTLSNTGNTYSGTTYNGLTLTGAADGFTLAGGTTPRTLTVTGANITVGSTITPTAAGGLTVQANGTNPLTLTGGANSTWSTTGGALTITSNQAATWSTANGGLTIQSASGTLSLGSTTVLTNTGANISLTSNGGSDVALNSNVQIRPGTDSSSSVQFENSSATATVASFGTNTTPANQNLIANPSMEDNANGWTKKGAVGVTATASDDFAQYGSRSLKIVTTAAIGDGASYSVPLKASTQYTLSAWVRLSTGTATTLNLNRQDNGADVDTCTSGNGIGMSVSTTWTQFTCTFTTGATVNGTTNVYVKQTNAAIRTIYVDGMTLVAGGSGLTFDAGGSNLNVQTLNSTVTLNANNSGDVQPWALSSTPVSTALRYGGTVNANGYIYNIGGCTTTCAAGTAITTVSYSKINADGSLSTWSTANPLPAARYGLTTLYINGYLYAIGGDSGTGVFGAAPQSTIYYTKMNNDGTLGTWQTSANTLTAAREFQTSMAVNGFIYAIGGDNAGAQSTVYYAKAYADGSISPWSTTTALTTGGAARRYATTVTANGYVYVIGGDTGGTAQSTVYENTINGDGTLGTTWVATTAINVGGAQARRHQRSVIVNGYVYVIGGDNGTAAQTTVYYSKLLPDGTIGAWQAASNPLPAARYGMNTLVINGYIYAIAGYDGTNPQSTVYYASTERVLVGGSLDLVGLSGESLTDAGGAGSLTAGNIRATGGLTVDGYADFNNGASIDSALNINSVSADTGQVVFNINNSSSNSIFSIRHMNANFGSLADAGAFVSNMSYIGQEFDKDTTPTATATNSPTTGIAIGDDAEWFARGSAATITYQTPRTTNGIGVLAFPTTTTTSGLMTMGSTAGTLNGLVAAANLPVVQMKIATTLNSATSDIYWGVGDSTTAATANDTPPTNGMFFWNNNAAGTWLGMVRNAGATVGTNVTCPGNVVVTAGHYATGRIEVLDSTHVHFMIDVDSTDGTNLVDCGTVTGTLPTAQLAPMIVDTQTAAQGATHVLDIDYARVWQDDSLPSPDDGLSAITADDSPAAADPSSTSDNSAAAADADQSTPLTNDSLEPESVGKLIDFAAASSDDAIFNNDVYVHGTVFANKIVANQIEGMDVITDKINSLSDELAKVTATKSTTPVSGTPPTNGLATNSGNSTGLLSLKNVQAVNLTVLTQLYAKGGFTVDGASTFNGTAQFKGQVSFNNDAGGTALIKQGDTKVQIKFTKAYQTTPIITANYLFNNSDSTVDQSNLQDLIDNGYSFVVTQTTTKGFTILLNKPADHDTNFSWLATQIDNPQVSKSADTPTSSN